MSKLPEAVRRVYKAEIQRLERALEQATEDEAAKIQESIVDLQMELMSEMFDID